MANNRCIIILLSLSLPFILLIDTNYAVSSDISPLRNTICAQIISGDLEQAIITVKYNNLLYKHDPLIIGLMSYAYTQDLLTEMPLAFLFYRRHYHKQILKTWHLMLKENPDNPYILKILAWLYSSDDRKKAEEFAGNAAAISGDKAFLFFIQGIMHEDKKNYELAINAFRNAYTADSCLRHLVSLAYTYQRANQPDSALYYFSKLPHQDTIYNYYLFGAVLCNMKKQNYDKAISLLDSMRLIRTDFYSLEKIDSLIKYARFYGSDSFAKDDSCVIVFGSLTVLLTCDSISYYTTGDIRKSARFDKVKWMTKKEYHENISAKGIKEQPYFIVLIEKNGTVFDIFPLISSGNYEVDEYLTQYLHKQTYKPATVFGIPTAASMIVGGNLYYK